ncbi:MAG: DUF3429 domain-containing protein [Pseudomonadota bacterium]
MPKAAWILGYAGLIPFVALPILTMTGLLSFYQSYQYFAQYSAIILSFFGGIHWITAIVDKNNSHQIFIAMLPSIIAWLSLILLSGKVLLTMLSLTFIGMFIYDKYALALPKYIVVDYIKLRLQLTTGVVICHLTMAYL